jgi:hypothetical protein
VPSNGFWLFDWKAIRDEENRTIQRRAKIEVGLTFTKELLL